MSPFHLAIPVTDLDQTLVFYQTVLGCEKGRESDRWVDLNFFGHQLVLQLVDGDLLTPASNRVDGHDVPAAHFGPVLDWAGFERLCARFEQHAVDYLIPPTVRFKGLPGEQATLFVQDPSGNCLEFKAFRNLEQLFAR
ncbi:MAG: VOC family protein [Pseudomonadota bacterium]